MGNLKEEHPMELKKVPNKKPKLKELKKSAKESLTVIKPLCRKEKEKKSREMIENWPEERGSDECVTNTVIAIRTVGRARWPPDPARVTILDRGLLPGDGDGSRLQRWERVRIIIPRELRAWKNTRV